MDMDLGIYPTNGTSEDILAFIARAEWRRQRDQGVTLPWKPTWLRMLLEPIFNLIGLALRWIAEACPAEAVLRVHNLGFGKLASDITIPFETDAPGLLEARGLAEKTEYETGKRPALLCIMSHPPVDHEWLNLNIEMARHVMLGLAAVRRGPTRPRIVIAIDSYGLDMLSIPVEALYAGFMGTYHLGIDRLALRRSWLSGFLIRSTAWSRMPFRFSTMLAKGKEAGIVLAGGVPQTTRTLYAVREFLSSLRDRRDRSKNPETVRRDLEQGSADFKAFLTSGAVGEDLHRDIWRLMEAWIAARVTGEWDFKSEGQPAEAYSGALSQGTKNALRACSEALGCSHEVFQERFRLFELEFHRETPHRSRFFRFISSRVVGRGRPVVLVPLRHVIPEGAEDRRKHVRLKWGHPVLLPDFHGSKDAADRFGESFVCSNFA